MFKRGTKSHLHKNAMFNKNNLIYQFGQQQEAIPEHQCNTVLIYAKKNCRHFAQMT